MSLLPTIAMVVEGHGETAALPELVRRIGREVHGTEIRCLPPYRVDRTLMTKQDGPMTAAVRIESGRVAASSGTVLVLADSDDDAPDALLADLQATADAVTPGAAVALIAVREYEAWFLAAIESLRGHRDVLADAQYDGDPEAVRGCKEALAKRMSTKYREVRHQVAFSSMLDLDTAAERSPSFRALVDAVEAAILRSV